MKKPMVTFGVLWVGISAVFAQQDIVFFSSTNPSYTGTSSSSYTFGYRFDVTTPITVTGLSAFTANPAAGLNENTPVGLWNIGQTEIASATVLAGTADPLTSDGLFRYATLSTPVTLSDGIYYVGAEVEAGVDKFAYNVNGLAAISGVTFLNPAFGPGTTLGFPDGTGIGSGDFGGNVVVAEVPEPESSILFSIGLTGLAILDRKKFLKSGRKV